MLEEDRQTLYKFISLDIRISQIQNILHQHLDVKHCEFLDWTVKKIQSSTSNLAWNLMLQKSRCFAIVIRWLVALEDTYTVLLLPNGSQMCVAPKFSSNSWRKTHKRKMYIMITNHRIAKLRTEYLDALKVSGLHYIDMTYVSFLYFKIKDAIRIIFSLPDATVEHYEMITKTLRIYLKVAFNFGISFVSLSRSDFWNRCTIRYITSYDYVYIICFNFCMTIIANIKDMTNE